MVRSYGTRKRILVTGGAGYVGSRVTAHLMSGGLKVTVFDSLVYGAQSLLPFAGAPLDAGFSLPGEIVARLSRIRLYFRVFDAADGRPLETWVWEKE